jgi:hypothetical protein
MVRVLRSDSPRQARTVRLWWSDGPQTIRSSNLRPSDHNVPKQVLGSKTLLRRLDNSVESALLLISCLPNIWRRPFHTNRPIKPMKSKGWSMRKQKPTKMAQKIAQSRSSSHPPPGIAWCFPDYPSSMCCPNHVWGGTAMNMYYWPNPFACLGWGAPQVFAYWQVDQANMVEEDAMWNDLYALKFYQLFILYDRKSRWLASSWVLTSGTK